MFWDVIALNILRYGRFVGRTCRYRPRQIEELLINNEANLADGMQSAMRAEDGKEWFHQAVPPDLTLAARLRGVDWLYAYMRGFYRDPSRPTGWNNAVFENVAMPHVLSDLQGVYMNGADGAMVQIRPGRLNETEYNEMVGDLVNFLSYAGEPSRAQRVKIGYLVMAFLLLLLLATYFFVSRILEGNSLMSITLYSGSYCPYSHRCRIVLGEKQMDVDICEVDLNDKPEELALYNPYNRVPVLVDRGLKLHESNIINEYLDDRFSSSAVDAH